MLDYLKMLVEKLYRPAAATPQKPSEQSCLKGDLETVGMDFSDWLSGRQLQSRLYGQNSESLDYLKEHAGADVELTLEAASKILNHEFNLLGSGSYQPVDPERHSEYQDYTAIDWYLDPVSNLRFPRDISYREWDLYKMRPGNADIKLPWELARCQHWPVLAQAFLLTSDEKYAREILRQLEDFMGANPLEMGIHWTCTMDVAIRAVNWSLALDLIRSCDGFEQDIWQHAYEALFDHGAFIYSNLENHYEVTSNHFLSNVVGLLFLSGIFRDLPQGKVWGSFSRESLEHEIDVQVLDDGADFESSVPYHRLVTELFLSGYRLSEVYGSPLSDGYRLKLCKMVNFLAGVLRPDGLMPQIGDADDGRLHILSNYGQWKPQDPRHIFGPAALILEETNFISNADDSSHWECCWWGLDPAEFRAMEGAPGDASVILSRRQRQSLPERTQHFPHAGLTCVRESGNYLLVTNGIVGTKGFGNHKHNDQLAFEFHAAGQPLLIDPGSHVYTSDPVSRNLFRSTAYHNTLRIDGVEQNEMNPEWLFRLFENANAETISFQTHASYHDYCGSHSGYGRLENAVTHERRLRVIRDSWSLLILDSLSGSGTHTIEWHFHAAPGVKISNSSIGRLLIEAGSVSYFLYYPAALECKIEDEWYSPSYGVKQPCQAANLRHLTTLNQSEWLFVLAPETLADDDSEQMKMEFLSCGDQHRSSR